MKNSAQKIKAKDFLEFYNVSSINVSDLIKIIESQGYKVIYLNKRNNYNEVRELLEEIGCLEYAKQTKAFTYKNGFNKIVFVDGNLQEKDMLHILAHEEGHIFCNHMERFNCSFANCEDEWEANEFAHYILNPPLETKIKIQTKSYKKILALLLILAAIIGLSNNHNYSAMINKNNIRTMDYYVTESGTKYHEKDCQYIKYSDNTRKITEEEYYSGKYEPCKKCKPE